MLARVHYIHIVINSSKFFAKLAMTNQITLKRLFSGFTVFKVDEALKTLFLFHFICIEKHVTVKHD